jgi:Protein of unknown function (DUF2281)
VGELVRNRLHQRYNQKSSIEIFVTIEQRALEKLRDLPAEKQKEVLDFVDFLKEKNGGPKKPLRSLLGLWSDLNVHITEEDIIEARREMWAQLPA